MSYRKRLAGLDERGSLVDSVPSRVILLTGQSSFVSSRLSPQQAAFLTAVASEPLLMGFPYHADFDHAYLETGVIAASIRNAMQFCWSLFSPRYRSAVARVLQEVIFKTSELLCIVTGSCGLQILASAWPLLKIPSKLQVRVVAVGPVMVGGAVPGLHVVQGRRDIWSRLLYRGNVSARCRCGHLDYWNSREVRDIVSRLLRCA